MICEEQIAPVGTFLESDLLAPVKNLVQKTEQSRNLMPFIG